MLMVWRPHPCLTDPRDQRLHDVSDEEVVHRHVPGAPVLGEVPAVPPLKVELAVPEGQQLGRDVERVVEDGHEAQQPVDGARQRQFEELLSRRW